MRSGRKKRKSTGLWTFHRFATSLIEKEKGSIELKSNAIMRMLLIYPNSYAVGMASLGFQTVYRIINEHPEARCERGFIWDEFPDFSGRSIESSDRLNRFDVIGFSLSYELDIPRVIKCLLESGIPINREDRTEKDPLVIVGGAVAGLNPSPLLPFMDGLLVGEGEDVLLQLVSTLVEGMQRKRSRQERLERFVSIEGIFIPSIQNSVKRHRVNSIENYPTFTPIITPKSHFESMFIVELSRGCPRPCLFCAGQKVYHPMRIHSQKSILETVNQMNPGAKRIGLEGAAISDHPELINICQSLISNGFDLSMSSLRPDLISKKLIDVLIHGNIRSITLAPEAGSESLRFNIGKNISDDEILNACRILKESPVEWLKLYFIIGFPSETIEDVKAISELVLECYDQFRSAGKRKRIRVSVNSFIPKPFTEFQWAPMDKETQINKKRKMIETALKGRSGIKISPKSVREEIVQGELSTGSINMGMAILNQIKDGLSWKQAKLAGHVNSTINEPRRFDVDLPWHFIHSDIQKKKLWERYQKYLKSRN